MPFVDEKAREIAQAALTSVESMREVIQEREVNAQRRWDEATRYFQGSFSRIEDVMKSMQNTYRDSIESLARRHEDAITRTREEFNEELRDFALQTDKRITEHHAEDDQRFASIDGWRWKAAWGLVTFLGLSTLSLIGVVYSLIPHH